MYLDCIYWQDANAVEAMALLAMQLQADGQEPAMVEQIKADFEITFKATNNMT